MKKKAKPNPTPPKESLADAVEGAVRYQFSKELQESGVVVGRYYRVRGSYRDISVPISWPDEGRYALLFLPNEVAK